MTEGSSPRTVDGGRAIAERESGLLAAYAVHSTDTGGRVHGEPPHPYRGPFQRDRDRIIHASAFRRLSDKTQVFTGDLGDYHRTRLTHTLEVASIGRSLARALRLNEDLVEALALLHDIGHPPFGHAGEDVLNDCLASEGGFDHNRQALRIVTQLEKRYPEFPGLNLSHEVLAGQAHRAGDERGAPPLEVQVVESADSIAYNTHDADDALEIGLLVLEEMLALPLWRDAVGRVRRRHPAIDGKALRRAIVHELINWLVSDVIEATTQRIGSLQLRSLGDVRRAPAIVLPSAEMAERQTELQTYLFHRVYRHPDVLAKRREVQSSLEAMFAHFAESPEHMPEKFRAVALCESPRRAAADYLAGMTDRFAVRVCEELTAGKIAPLARFTREGG